MNPRIVSHHVGVEGFKRHCQADFLRLEPPLRIEEFEAAHAGGEIGAIDGGQSISFAERNRRNASGCQSLFRRPSLPLVEHLAIAHERDGHLRHRRKIPTCAHRPFLAHHRGDAAVEHLDLDFYDLAANPGMAPAMSVQA